MEGTLSSSNNCMNLSGRYCTSQSHTIRIIEIQVLEVGREKKCEIIVMEMGTDCGRHERAYLRVGTRYTWIERLGLAALRDQMSHRSFEVWRSIEIAHRLIRTLIFVILDSVVSARIRLVDSTFKWY